MNRKTQILLFAFSAGLVLQALPSKSSAAPLVSIGDNTDLFFNGSSSLRWTSNVFRDQSDEVDDLTLTFSPGFEVNVGRGLSNADFSVITRYDIVRYQDQDQLDTELFHIKALGSYKTSRLDLSGSVSFDESKTSAGDQNVVRDLIEFDTFAVNLDGAYRFSPKFSFGSGVSYTDQEYKTYEELFADRETYTIPFNLFYELTPKVDLSAGYAYTNTDIEGSESVVRANPVFPLLDTRSVSDYEQASHFFNVGARGNLLPKLTGFFRIGYRARDIDDSTIVRTPLNYPGPVTTSTTNRDDTGMLGLDADLTWTTTPKLTTRLALSRDFGVGGEGESTENTSLDLSGSFAINQNFSASANLGYTLRDYTNDGREDNQYDLGFRLSYVPNQHWRFSTGYTYSENDSDDNLRSYENHMLDLTASLRY